MPQIVLPPRSRLQATVSRVRQARIAVRVYQLTPPSLRRREPVMRIGVGFATVWFSAMFASLAVTASRSSSPHLAVVGYLGATLAGPAGLCLFLTRRCRVGAALIVAMLVVGQTVAVASAVVA